MRNINKDIYKKGNKIIVSICVLTYNHEAFIEKALESFLMQKVDFDFEILIHDDASTDNTKEILQYYKKKYPDLFNLLLQTENQRSKFGGGMNPRFNYPRAKGKYIALCEGDDYWTDPLKLQKQVDFLEANPDFVGVFHNTKFIDERRNNIISKPWREYKQDVFTAKDTIRTLSLFHTSSYCFRNLDYNYLLMLDSKLSSGDMFLLGLISKFGKLKLLDESMSVYRKNDGGVTSSESLIKYHKNRINLNKILNHYFDYKFMNKSRKVISFHKKKLFKLKYPNLHRLKTIFYNSFKRI